jgi:transcriptional regulator with XRE-family HTH domain
MSATPQQTIGQRLRSLRENLKLSQAEFGARCEPAIRREHICHYETGKQIPGWPVLARLAAAAGVTQAQLIDGVSFERAAQRSTEREDAPRNPRRRSRSSGRRKLSREVHARTITRGARRR